MNRVVGFQNAANRKQRAQYSGTATADRQTYVAFAHGQTLTLAEQIKHLLVVQLNERHANQKVQFVMLHNPRQQQAVSKREV